MNQKTVWNKIAPQWDKYRNTPFKPAERFLSRKKRKILDVGCGSGRNFSKKKDLEFYGVDFSKEMISLAKQKNIAKELGVMKKEKIPYENNSFDSVICVAVLHCIKSKKKRQKLISEIYRVLKPNSEAFISVWSKNYNKLQNKGKFTKIPWKINKKQFQRNTYIYEKDEIENELKSVGFKIKNSEEERNIKIIVKKSS